MINGAVWLETMHGIGRIRRAKKPLTQGETLHLYYDSDIQSQTAHAARLVSDEGDYSIWDKPCGMFSQGSKWGDHCTVYRWAEQHLKPGRSAFLVHRLDRAARGLIIITHNKRTTRAFAQMFRHHAITKHYRAIVEGDLSTIDLPYLIDQPLDDKKAETLILQADYNAEDQATSLRLDIKSGRKHQIRKHLSSIGHPILGDRLYGAKDTRVDLQLSSVYLSFICPVKSVFREYVLQD
jgi:tRNA pseudouridine32 synthase/23S rRNA pseudouridine746 synthase